MSTFELVFLHRFTEDGDILPPVVQNEVANWELEEEENASKEEMEILINEPVSVFTKVEGGAARSPPQSSLTVTQRWKTKMKENRKCWKSTRKMTVNRKWGCNWLRRHPRTIRRILRRQGRLQRIQLKGKKMMHQKLRKKKKVSCRESGWMFWKFRRISMKSEKFRCRPVKLVRKNVCCRQTMSKKKRKHRVLETKKKPPKKRMKLGFGTQSIDGPHSNERPNYKASGYTNRPSKGNGQKCKKIIGSGHKNIRKPVIQFFPISWMEMYCPVTDQKEPRKWLIIILKPLFVCVAQAESQSDSLYRFHAIKSSSHNDFPLSTLIPSKNIFIFSFRPPTSSYSDDPPFFPAMLCFSFPFYFARCPSLTQDPARLFLSVAIQGQSRGCSLLFSVCACCLSEKMKPLNQELTVDNTRRRNGYCDELEAKNKAQPTRSGSIHRSLKFGLNLELINLPNVSVRLSLLRAEGEAKGSGLDDIGKVDTSFSCPHLCVVVGLSDSKVWLHSSHVYHEAKHAFAYHGVKFSFVEVDLAAMMIQKDKVVANLTQGIDSLDMVNCVKGFGKFVSPSEIFVDAMDDGKAIVNGKNMLIASSILDRGWKFSKTRCSEVVSCLMTMIEKKRNHINTHGKIIASYYVDGVTPQKSELLQLVSLMQASGADFIKVATHAADITEILRIFSLIPFSQVPLIAYSVGERGLISHVLSPKFGGHFVCGSLAGNPIPGVPSLYSLREAYKWENINVDTKAFG